jgi:hypothetical protein
VLTSGTKVVDQSAPVKGWIAFLCSENAGPVIWFKIVRKVFDDAGVNIAAGTYVGRPSTVNLL